MFVSSAGTWHDEGCGGRLCWSVIDSAKINTSLKAGLLILVGYFPRRSVELSSRRIYDTWYAMRPGFTNNPHPGNGGFERQSLEKWEAIPAFSGKYAECTIARTHFISVVAGQLRRQFKTPAVDVRSLRQPLRPQLTFGLTSASNEAGHVTCAVSQPTGNRS